MAELKENFRRTQSLLGTKELLTTKV